jgi:5-methylcytosine-specific restriction enzyme A
MQLMTPAENERFTSFLRQAAEESRRAGYPPNNFVRMLNAEGGFETAKRLLLKSAVSEGFVELFRLQRLDLTVEALVVESEWARLFEPELLAIAEKRLRDVGYTPKHFDHTGKGVVDAPEIRQVETDPGHAPSLRSSLLSVMRRYGEESQREFTGNPLAGFIRNGMRDVIARYVHEEDPRLLVKGSAGQGRWVKGPWAGIFDPVITNGAQRGYYPCYLFREDMRGVYLSLNQGMTEARAQYKSDAKTALQARAANFRALLGPETASFPEREIDLAPDSPSNDTAFYEAGNICATYYPLESVPPNSELITDLREMVRLYRQLVHAEASADTTLDNEDDSPPGMEYEDASRFRMHKRIERNAALTRKVKKLRGLSCEICGVNFKKRYGSIGEGYIEAHHLRPLASLNGAKVAMNPATDFAVLCANCHRMVHRSGLVDDIARFRNEHFSGHNNEQ